MEAATVEQSSGDKLPVFVTGRRHRSHAVRLAAAALGLLLAGWLAALIAGLVGFSTLPELTFPGAGAARAPAVASEGGSGPTVEHVTGAHASPVAARPQRGGGQANADVGAAANSPPSASGSGAKAAAGQAAGDGTGSAAPEGGGSATQAPASPGTGASPASSGDGPPSFTPPASGEKSASPPRGNSAAAPGRAHSAAPERTVSADPPGKATRPHSG